MRVTAFVFFFAAPLAFSGCTVPDSAALSDPEAAPQDGLEAPQSVDYLDDELEQAVPASLDEVLAPPSDVDFTLGVAGAADYIYEQVRQEFGEEEIANMPDLLALWTESQASEERDADVEEGPDCAPAAIVGGVWHRQRRHYAGLWFAPRAEVLGPMVGHYRGLATPGGQWGGGFGTFDARLGPQGGMWNRNFDGTGQFGGLWSAPTSPYEGHIGGHWITLGPRGGFYFGVMSVCDF